MYHSFVGNIVIVLILIYICIIPSGVVGFLLTLFCLFLKLLQTKNLLTLATFLLLFGIKSAGLVSIAFGQPGLGGKVALLLSTLILLGTVDFRLVAAAVRKPIYFVIWISFLTFCAFLYGPQSIYSKDKLIGIITAALFGTLLFYLLIFWRQVAWAHLGKLGVICALLCYAIAIMVEPSVKPANVFDFGAMRNASFHDSNIFEVRNLVAGIALLSFALLIASSPDRQDSRSSLRSQAPYLLVSLLLLLWAGSRLPIFSAFLVVLSMPLARPRDNSRYRKLLLILCTLLLISFIYMYKQNLPFITTLSNDSASLASRFNRDTNWDAAIRRISESPFWGHGLGGYYIEGYSYPGSGTYAHNLFLEILSESGLIGLIFVCLPLFAKKGKMRFGKLVGLRSANGDAVFPILFALFLQAMISFDLSTNISLFSLLSLLLMTKYPIHPHTFPR